jgi:hypothetical protein
MVTNFFIRRGFSLSSVDVQKIRFGTFGIFTVLAATIYYHVEYGIDFKQALTYLLIFGGIGILGVTQSRKI